MFASVLIANRGEIAVRIARSAKRLGMRVIAVYSEADASALHVRVADEAYLIGPPPARESYLVIDRIIEAASLAHADCIHPGYGFLSENPRFAEACADAGIVFVGPPPSAIRAMGLKDQAKALMEKAGVPVVPGYHGELQDPKFLKEKAYQIGYPVLIKAVAGGGGKGMRRVDKHAEFDAALEGATREGQSSFSDARVLIEKYVTAPRHIEMQVFADSHRNVIHLNERDCSLQRRHQKVIEEAPAPGMIATVRDAMGRAATEAARAVGYQGAGTVEFIADGSRGLRPDGFWFMEMNTRLQVEHPVTEAITGLDLVELQFRVAAGEKLPLTQGQVRIDGHAAEARLYAEDPARNFLPSTGKLAALEFPVGEGIRIDTGVEPGSVVSPYYDPMIAKVIAHGADRAQALARLAQALGETVVVGPHANAAFLAALVSHPDFLAGRFDTGFIDRNLSELIRIDPAAEAGVIGAAVEVLLMPKAGAQADTPWRDPWGAADAFSLGPRRQLTLDIVVDGRARKAAVTWPNGPQVSVDGVTAAQGVRIVAVAGGVVAVGHGLQRHVALKSYDTIDVDHLDGDGVVKAPMHGKVLAIFVAVGASVTKGERVAVVEAMKMEHALLAPVDGTVSEVVAEAGMQIAEGARILSIEARGE
jgi:3-methylcrotonyl-CoA carboxylase alpha subunit